MSRLTVATKISGVVLPVYFRQVDACVVARRDFQVMCELNPDLSQKLRVIATSPKVITNFMAFHRDCPPRLKEKFLGGAVQLHQTVTGQQVLTLFQSRRLVTTDVSVLQPSLDLLAASRRLHKSNTAKPTAGEKP